MRQEYDKYNDEDLQVWQTLFKRQKQCLQEKASDVYLSCVEKMKSALNENEIPDFRKMNEVLSAKHGWTLEVVPGMIPVGEFFNLLAKKKFCSSTWLRKMSELDYLEEPDMFHDIFGHTPLLMNEDFSKFAQRIGEIGSKNSDNQEVLDELQRIYWFTIEFGVIQEEDKVKCYGAGIMSSFGEVNHIYEDDIKILPYDIDMVVKKTFINSEIQNDYVKIHSYAELFESLDILEKRYEALVG